MKRSQKTRHGPAWEQDHVRFRLWAPSAHSVDLLLSDHKPEAMQNDGDGWHEYADRRAKSGDRYFFRIDGRLNIPDPASRFQPEGVTGASELVKSDTFSWSDDAWRNRPWEEAVIYELHTGTYTPDGNYKGIEEKLGHLQSLGITAIELMPLAAFAGQRGWGYDGVFPYAPFAPYGKPDELKHLINTAHRAGIMVFLDVVYNHFGPAGNFLNEYAKPFFTEKYKTPWGCAIDMETARPVRDFFIDNALYWLNEYNFDGLRFDAVHAIFDDSQKHILAEISERVRQQNPEKHIILENDKNEAKYLKYDGGFRPLHFTAQWNDDIHHIFHVLLSGEKEGYYEDYKDNTLDRLGRCLTQGFDYQGEPSVHRQGKKRGEKSDDLPPHAFISLLQNHDQIGNRAMGERLVSLTSKDKLILATTVLLLAPQPPMLFMGEEWATETPFLYFCDFEGTLADQVREGRRNEFKDFPAFSSPEMRSRIPDPNADTAFQASSLNWDEADGEAHRAHLTFTKHMLELRRKYIIPLLKSGWIESHYRIKNEYGLDVSWTFHKGTLRLLANFSDKEIENILPSKQTLIYGPAGPSLPAWTSLWYVEAAHG